MSRILGIDYGTERTGIAITDELGITAQGLETINSNGSDKVLLRRIEEILNEYKTIEKIVIGNPINMDGSPSQRSEETDERLTTVEAHKTMNYLDINKRKKKDIVDTIAAVYILETYINQK